MARSHPALLADAHNSPGQSESLQSLQEKVQRYELIFKATKDVVYELNLEDATVEWSDALYTQYGYNHSEPANSLEWWTHHVHPDDALLLENKITDLFGSETNSWQYDYRFRRADGNYNYVHDRGLLLRDSNGRPTKIIGSLLDVTAQKQLDIAKDEFISLVSHQLRTPLTVIRVYGEMLTSGIFGDLNTEQAQWVRNMTSSSVRLIDVVGAILNVSRIDLGRIRIVPSPRDMTELVSNCIKEVVPLAAEKQVSITFEPAAGLPEVALDETIFAQIVHNLLTNAIRYTRPKQGIVTVRLGRRAGDYVLSVHDNGIGIPKEARDHIFERFYRAKNALGMEVQGSGLGLYLIKVMCDAFGGKVWFRTGKQEGTTFYVQIPKTGMTASRSVSAI
jgi:two-component system CheB/CheR fusion protein